MAEYDNNPILWKWEYIPWISNAPVVLGRKSREEIDRQYMSMFRRLPLYMSIFQIMFTYD